MNAEQQTALLDRIVAIELDARILKLTEKQCIFTTTRALTAYDLKHILDGAFVCEVIYNQTYALTYTLTV